MNGSLGVGTFRFLAPAAAVAAAAVAPARLDKWPSYCTLFQHGYAPAPFFTRWVPVILARKIVIEFTKVRRKWKSRRRERANERTSEGVGFKISRADVKLWIAPLE